MSMRIANQSPDVFYSFGECYDRKTFKRIENLDQKPKLPKKTTVVAKENLGTVGKLIKKYENS